MGSLAERCSKPDKINASSNRSRWRSCKRDLGICVRTDNVVELPMEMASGRAVYLKFIYVDLILTDFGSRKLAELTSKPLS